MLNEEFFYPTVSVKIGSYFFDTGVTFDVFSSKEKHFDWAKVRFTKEFVDKVSFNKMDDVKIYLGYSGNNEAIFDGYVKRTVNTGMTLDNEIVAKDEMIKLEETRITETFLNVSPQEIIQYGLDKAGIKNYKIKSQTFVKKPTLVVARKNIVELMGEVNRIWGINERFFFLDKIFYWGEIPDQDEIYEFIYGENIINMTFKNGFWVFETISAPFVRHSHKINVTHPSISGIFEVYRVHYSVNEKGFPRTEIYFI
ncbi:hypothetical protein [Maledivibacter halophilus]|uniref:Uncharacterized protein n=1 Tax=Maledivibacter halophilus TaxID=36842 RepID=A0A1T5L715_9FIRM|nr:hypothetical protein [Maledivibacter halophilus]SKC68225.1 hypothetical protein SAMN02194393_02129 [Maledivibacter halophilus]SKC71856.1 hypothetical protein SAMN02194393_02523 [Maledivibacter halophilus]SKC80123.1 hypothetical protein SAMN02194393_03440 [Maledivibacter halophilus]